jgi:hypothetical protein
MRSGPLQLLRCRVARISVTKVGEAAIPIAVEAIEGVIGKEWKLFLDRILSFAECGLCLADYFFGFSFRL